MVRIQDLIEENTLEELQKSTFKRGAVYRVSIPFKMELPFGLFYCNRKADKSKKIIDRITCDNCDNQCSGIFVQCKGIVENYESKDIGRISDLGNRSIPINTVQKLKVRPFLIISSNFDIYKMKAKFIYGIPIYSLKEKQLSNNKFMGKLKNNKIPNFYYIDKPTQGVSKPSMLDLRSIVSIHKDLFVQYKGYLDDDDMMIISEKINYLLDLNQFDEIKDIDFLRNRKSRLEEELLNITDIIDELEKEQHQRLMPGT